MKYKAYVVENDYELKGCPCVGAIKVISPDMLGFKKIPEKNISKKDMYKKYKEYYEVVGWIPPLLAHPMDVYVPKIGEQVYIEQTFLGNFIWVGLPHSSVDNFFDSENPAFDSLNLNLSAKNERFFALRNGSYIKLVEDETGIIRIESLAKTSEKIDRKGCFIEIDGTEDSEKITLTSQNKDGSKKSEIIMDATKDADKVKVSVLGTLNLTLDGTKDSEKIEITDGVNTLTLDTKNKKLISKNESNEILSNENGIKITDKNSNIIEMASAGTKITDSNGNNIEMAGSGITIKDANGNEVKMGSASLEVKGTNVKITGGNLMVDGMVAPGTGPFCALPNCLFAGAPHGGNLVAGT